MERERRWGEATFVGKSIRYIQFSYMYSVTTGSSVPNSSQEKVHYEMGFDLKAGAVAITYIFRMRGVVLGILFPINCVVICFNIHLSPKTSFFF